MLCLIVKKILLKKLACHEDEGEMVDNNIQKTVLLINKSYICKSI